MTNIVEALNKSGNILKPKPASPQQISKAEGQLGLCFSDEYKEYLAHFGFILAEGIELSNIYDAENTNVVAMTRQEWGLNPLVPHSLYVVQNPHINGIIIWQDASGAVYSSAPNSKPKKIATSLAQYIVRNIM